MTSTSFGDSLDASDPYSSAFQPAKLTVPQLRSLLLEHSVHVPSTARKAALIQAYEENVRANADDLRTARNRNRNIRPDANGITTITGSPLERTAGSSSSPRMSAGASLHPGAPKIDTLALGEEDKTIIYHSEAEDSSADHRRPRSALSRGSTPRSRRSVSWADSVHSDEETGSESASASIREGARQRDNMNSPNVENVADTSNFSPINPFQRPLDALQQSSVPSRARKSEPAARHAHLGSYSDEDQGRKTARHSLGAPGRKRNSMPPQKTEADEAKQKSPAKRHAGPRRSRVASRKISKSKDDGGESEHLDVLQFLASLFWTAAAAASLAYYIYYVLEGKAVGFCDAGRHSNNIMDRRDAEQLIIKNSKDVQDPSWTRLIPRMSDALRPSCTPCPAHGVCDNGRLSACESGDFVMRQPLLAHLSLVSSALPLRYVAPRCDPDEEKVMLAAELADEIESHLRHFKGDVACGRAKPKRGQLHDKTSMVDQNMRNAVPLQEMYTFFRAAAERSTVVREQEHDYFQELWDLATQDLLVNERVSRHGDALVAERSALGMGLFCRSRLAVGGLWRRLRLAAAGVLLLFIAIQWLRSRLQGNSKVKQRAQELVDVALGKLQRAKQRGQYLSGNNAGEDPYLSIAQLRDTVLRHESNEATRRLLWARVSRIVEANTNVRTRQAKVQGEWARVWEWVGPLDEWGASSPVLGNPYSPGMASLPNSRAVSASHAGWHVSPRYSASAGVDPNNSNNFVPQSSSGYDDSGETEQQRQHPSNLSFRNQTAQDGNSQDCNTSFARKPSAVV